jgi:hypothetical protein
MTVAEMNARALHRYLKANPKQLNTSESLAAQLGITSEQVDAALRWVRENCIRLGWTIPWVERGSEPKHYHVVDTFGASEIRELLDGTNDEVTYVRSNVERRRLQAELCVNRCRRPGSNGYRRALTLLNYIDQADWELWRVETT